jgi:hypothetical protein
MHRIVLPDAPAHMNREVKAWRQAVPILTYQPERPDPNPMFLERRVYQGSSRRVYPLRFIGRIAVEPREKLWQAVHIENQYLLSDGLKALISLSVRFIMSRQTEK